MKKLLKWIGYGLGAIAGVLLVAAVWVYVSSGHIFARHYHAVAQRVLAIPTDAASIAEGAHLAALRGCIACHGDRLEGGGVFDIPYVARLIAPNISGAAQKFTPEQLATIIQQGIKPDGTGIWIMPSSMYKHLTDQDLARIIAFVRSVPATAGTTERSEFRIGVRAMIALGKVKSEAVEAAALPAESAPGDPKDPIARGRYLVMTDCVECHGQNLEGSELAQSPPLIVVKGYSAEDFATLMRTGVAIGGRKLDLMRETATMRYVHFTDQELADVYAFLHSR